MNNRFRGTGVALVTPFDEEYKIDFEALRKVVDHTIAGGVDYLVVMGTTGESVTISEAEKDLVLQVVTENKKGKPLVLGLAGTIPERSSNSSKIVTRELMMPSFLFALTTINRHRRE
jgi:dihydrodipicolinate synthase/N-acetylneuraminate lyase